MSDWKTDYSKKLRTTEEALKLIPSHSSIITSHVAAEPRTFLAALAAHKDEYENVNIFMTHARDQLPYCTPETKGHFNYSTCFLGTESRKAVNTHIADYITGFYHERPRLVGVTIPVDIAILSVSTPDEHGYCSFGVTVDYQMTVARTAPTIIGIVNKYMPRTLGYPHLHISEMDYIVEIDEPLPQSRFHPSAISKSQSQNTALRSLTTAIRSSSA
jgi:4-hydroxybutyrate CoA-transferase